MTCQALAAPISDARREAVNEAAVDEIMHLRAALASRDVIGQAKGVLMALDGCTADEAFAILRDRSQRTNIKLRIVAERVVAERTGRPPLAQADALDTTPNRRAAMAREDRTHVTIQHEERTVAAAEIETSQNEAGPHASMTVDAGQLPPGTRTQLVDAVLDLPEMAPGTRLTATVPAGDGEMLDRMRERCSHVETRRAGVSLIVDATVDDPSVGPT